MAYYGTALYGGGFWGTRHSILTAAGNYKFYDKRCRHMIIMGSKVWGQIAKNSIFRRARGNGYYGTTRGKYYQMHYKYYTNIGAPGSKLKDTQDVFRQATVALKALTEAQKAPYRQMEAEYFTNRHNYMGSYTAKSWWNFFLSEKLKELYGT